MIKILRIHSIVRESDGRKCSKDMQHTWWKQEMVGF